jgi:hypothetical protein
MQGLGVPRGDLVDLGERELGTGVEDPGAPPRPAACRIPQNVDEVTPLIHH